MIKRAADRGFRLGRCGVAACAVLLWGFGCATRPLDETRPAPAFDSGRVARTEVGPEYDVLVAELASRGGDLRASREAYARAIVKDPNSATLRFKSARLAAENEDFEAAVSEAEIGLALDPNDLDGRLFLGRLYRVTRNTAGLESVLRDESGQPINGAATLLLFQVYLDQGRLDESLALAEQLLAAEPDNLSAYMAAATAYERAGRVADA
ncbi:tetratricopeptide repeat protein, partial [Myxococcota bacterium]|nr:tetratricopeptide repeat protein [Myxococcota bacterium]